MTATAKLSNYRQAPRKVRLVATLLKGKKVEDALLEVKMLDKRAAPILEKLIRSAVANAKEKGIEIGELFIKEFRVDKGVVLKRSMPRAFGRAFPIHKHSSNIIVVLDSKDEKKSVTKKETTDKEVTPKTSQTTTASANKSEKKVVKKTTAKKTTK